MKSLILTLMFAIACTTGYAQKKELISEKEKVVERAKQELDAAMANPESDLRKQIAKNQIKGEFIFDITIAGKGLVLTVFAVSSDVDDIKKQNAMKDVVKTLTFNFKMPKDKSFKFQYTFNV